MIVVGLTPSRRRHARLADAADVIVELCDRVGGPVTRQTAIWVLVEVLGYRERGAAQVIDTLRRDGRIAGRSRPRGYERGRLVEVWPTVATLAVAA